MSSKAKPIKGITREEWLTALGQAELPEDPSALTIEELRKLLGGGRESVKVRVDKLITIGKAKKVTKRILRADGASLRVTAYKLL